jgi:hypothetical protein
LTPKTYVIAKDRTAYQKVKTRDRTENNGGNKWDRTREQQRSTTDRTWHVEVRNENKLAEVDDDVHRTSESSRRPTGGEANNNTGNGRVPNKQPKVNRPPEADLFKQGTTRKGKELASENEREKATIGWANETEEVTLRRHKLTQSKSATTTHG